MMPGYHGTWKKSVGRNKEGKPFEFWGVKIEMDEKLKSHLQSDWPQHVEKCYDRGDAPDGFAFLEDKLKDMEVTVHRKNGEKQVKIIESLHRDIQADLYNAGVFFCIVKVKKGTVRG